MFAPTVYAARREALVRRLGEGVALVVGATDAPMNYRDNPYPFVQDGSFSWLFGLRQPDLIGLIDLQNGKATLFGHDDDLESIVWTGRRPGLVERAAAAGVSRTAPLGDLAPRLAAAQRSGRTIHYPPAYRGETVLSLCALLGQSPVQIADGWSRSLVQALVALREIKAPEEIAEIEAALAITAAMHRRAMACARPGVVEREVVGEIEAVVRRLDLHLAYPVIFSRSGEILHNLDHSQTLSAGDVVVNDSGAMSAEGYASDITRTLPVGGFTPRGRELYEIVLRSQEAAIAAVRPGASFLAIHKLAMRRLVEGLAGLGVFPGDPEETVESGAYAVVCQGGLGHPMGLDVHDMEGLGEDLVGYDDTVARSPLFGMNRLRFGRSLRAGMVMTVEPGLYFIPPLIERWAAEGRHAGLIDYGALARLSDAGGYRVEDDVLVTLEGGRVLGPPIPKSVAELNAGLTA